MNGAPFFGVGNITRDPELRFTQAGVAFVNFGLAVNRRFQRKGASDWDEETTFFDVTAWGDLADNAATSLAKGDRVIVEGRLEQQNWETDAGEKRSKIAVVADDIGPSLRWATAEVTKAERRTPAHAGASNGRPAGANQYAPDEEPF